MFCPVIIIITDIVNIYETGSFDPDSISNNESVPYFKDK